LTSVEHLDKKRLTQPLSSHLRKGRLQHRRGSRSGRESHRRQRRQWHRPGWQGRRSADHPANLWWLDSGPQCHSFAAPGLLRAGSVPAFATKEK